MTHDEFMTKFISSGNVAKEMVRVALETASDSHEAIMGACIAVAFFASQSRKPGISNDQLADTARGTIDTILDMHDDGEREAREMGADRAGVFVFPTGEQMKH